MANKKQKGVKGKKAGRKSRTALRETFGVPTPNMRSMIKTGLDMGNHHKQVCALTNPFCDEARGSRIPDDDSSSSQAVTIKGYFAFNSDAAGLACFSVKPNPSAVFRVATAIAGSTITTFGGWSAFGDYAAIAASLDKYRVVSFGVRIYSTLAPSDQSGLIKAIVTPVEMTNGSSVAGGLFQQVDAAPVANSNVYWVSKPIGTTWKEYNDLTTTCSATQLTVYLSGCKVSTTVGHCEIIMHLEATADFGSVMAGTATPGVAHNPTALTAASTVHRRSPDVSHEPNFLSTLGSLAKSAVLDVASAVMPGLSGKMASLMLGGSRRANRYQIVD